MWFLTGEQVLFPNLVWLKDNMIMRPEELEVYKIVDSSDEVLQAIANFEQELEQGQHMHIKATTDDFSI